MRVHRVRTGEEIDQRIDQVVEQDFSWSPLAIPAVDGSKAAFVANNKARQQVLLNNRDILEYGVIKQVEARARVIALEEAAEGETLDAAAINAATEKALAELTPEEREVYDRASAMKEFAKTFAIEIGKAGLAYVGAEVIRDLCGLVHHRRREGPRRLQAIQAARQLKKAKAMADAAAELTAP